MTAFDPDKLPLRIYFPKDQVLWLGEPAEVVEVRQDRIWIRCADGDRIMSTYELTAAQLAHEAACRTSLLGPV